MRAAFVLALSGLANGQFNPAAFQNAFQAAATGVVDTTAATYYPRQKQPQLQVGAYQRGPATGTTQAQGAMNRFADGTEGLLFGLGVNHDGCGIHPDCYTCMASDVGQGRCIWDAAVGCVSSRGQTSNLDPTLGLALCMRNPDTAVADTCPEVNNCKACTTRSGCIWNRGKCVYSRGDGCLHDPINCANFDYQCPADPVPTPLDGGVELGGGADLIIDRQEPAPPAADPLNDLLLMMALTGGLGGGGGHYGPRGGHGGGRYYGPSYNSFGGRGGGHSAFGGGHSAFGGGGFGMSSSGGFGRRPVGPAPVPPMNQWNSVHGTPHQEYTGHGILGLGHGGVGHTGGGPIDPLAAAMIATGNLDLNDIPGATFLPDRDIGLLNGLVGESVNIWESTTDVDEPGILGLDQGQHPLCLPGDVFCNSAALDPFAPHNLDPAYEILDNIGVGHQELSWAEYGPTGFFQPADYREDYHNSLPGGANNPLIAPPGAFRQPARHGGFGARQPQRFGGGVNQRLFG